MTSTRKTQWTIAALACAGIVGCAVAQSATGGVTAFNGEDVDKSDHGVDGGTADGGQPAGHEKKCQPESQQVDMDSAEGGWVVTREGCPNEKAVVLSYSYGDATKGVEGRKTGGVWVFGIADKIPDDAVIRLEFRVLLDAENAQAARGKLSDFANELLNAVKISFDDSVAKTQGTPFSARWSLLLDAFTAEARVKASGLAKSKDLPYFADKIPAVDFVLQKAHFQKMSDGNWEPAAATLQDLNKAYGDPIVKELLSAQDTVKHYREVPVPACVGGDYQSIDGATKEVRARALADCLKALLSSADALQVATAGVATLKPLADGAAADVAKALVYLPAVDAVPKPGADFTVIPRAYLAAMDSIEIAMREAQTKREADARKAAPAGRDKANQSVAAAKAAVDAFAAARAAIDFVAAREVVEQVGPAWQKKLDDMFLPNLKQILDSVTIVRQAQVSQLLRVKPALPRFFLSTGVAVTSLNDFPGKVPNKLSVPILASICWSSRGCQTKGIGSGSGALSYLSLDLGVKVMYIGQKNPRESSPSFLLGLGMTPIYATHLSLGLNVFDNPQTNRANVAGFLSITLDTIDGAAILGALGMGKPSAEPIGGGSTPEGESKQ